MFVQSKSLQLLGAVSLFSGSSAAVCETGWHAVTGTGGCANGHGSYRTDYIVQHAHVSTTHDCAQMCNQHSNCKSYNFCDGSNCAGLCDLYEGVATDATGYPSTQCCTRPDQAYCDAGWEQVTGVGGCGNGFGSYRTDYIVQHAHVKSTHECANLCNQHSDCNAYNYCDGSNCAGICDLYRGRASDTTGYPATTCCLRPTQVGLDGANVTIVAQISGALACSWAGSYRDQNQDFKELVATSDGQFIDNVHPEYTYYTSGDTLHSIKSNTDGHQSSDCTIHWSSGGTWYRLTAVVSMTTPAVVV